MCVADVCADSIRDAEKERLGLFRDQRAKDAVLTNQTIEAVDQERTTGAVDDDSILLKDFPTKEELLGSATAIIETFARYAAHQALIAATKMLDSALDEAADIPQNVRHTVAQNLTRVHIYVWLACRSYCGGVYRR